MKLHREVCDPMKPRRPLTGWTVLTALLIGALFFSLFFLMIAGAQVSAMTTGSKFWHIVYVVVLWSVPSYIALFHPGSDNLMDRFILGGRHGTD